MARIQEIQQILAVFLACLVLSISFQDAHLFKNFVIRDYAVVDNSKALLSKCKLEQDVVFLSMCDIGSNKLCFRCRGEKTVVPEAHHLATFDMFA